MTELPTGAFFALAIAASPLSILGIGSSVWALVGGVLVSLAIERPALLRALRGAAVAASESGRSQDGRLSVPRQGRRAIHSLLHWTHT